jgi:nucleoside-diphosphate-sugar epimerase
VRILITGSTGFVGQNLVAYGKSMFPNWKYTFLNRNDLNKTEIADFFVGIDVVLHFAGKAHDILNTSNSKEYYDTNFVLTLKLYNDFIKSNAGKFIFISSVKAVADNLNVVLDESYIPNPQSAYGKSKLLAEQFILSNLPPDNKSVYILRPCMIHGPQNKGNLNLLYKIVKNGFPWPLGSFDNKRSFCSIENLCFVIKELIERENISSGVYNIADSEPVSTNQLIQLISISQNKKPIIFTIPKRIIYLIAKLGDVLHLPLNTERLRKLTETYLVSNQKLLTTLGKELPVSSREGLIKTFQSFSN